MSDAFEFRDFTMLQAAAGQRINTDSCVFGGLVGEDGSKPRKILDIGAGTGVVSLMVAHRFPDAEVTAVESEHSIADIARENFGGAIWQNRIALVNSRIQDLDAAQCGPFDLVLCNPPYFQNSKPSADPVTAVARHNFDLSPLEIYQAMLRFMTPEGTAWLSFPEDCADLWLSAGKGVGLVPTRHFILSDHPAAKPHVVIVGWARVQATIAQIETLYYRTAPRGDLSPWMKDFRRRWFPARFNKNTYAVDP